MPAFVVPYGNATRVYHTATNGTVLINTFDNTRNTTYAATSFVSGLFYINTTAMSSTMILSSATTSCDSWFTHNYQVVSEDEEQARIHRLHYQRERERKIHRAKGSVKRALKLMDGVGFGNDIRIFLRGDSIEIAHPDSMFKFVMHRDSYGTILDKTISAGVGTPYVLDLYTKTDVFVASLCVYLKDTPILDQVLAVSMFIKSGDEDIILKQANWFKLTKDEDVVLDIAVNYPELEDKVKLQRFGPLPLPNRLINIEEANYYS